MHSVWDTRIYHRQAKSLAQAGYQVTIVATGVENQQTVDNIKIIGLPRPARRLGRAANWLRFAKAALGTKADLYHFHDPDLLFVGLFLAQFTKRPVIYDSHDPYVEAIYQREWLPLHLRFIVSRIFDVLEKQVAKRLSAVIIANDAQQARFPQAALVRNYPDLAAFKAVAKNNPPIPLVVHAGMLTEPRGAFELVEIAKLLAHRNLDFFVLGPFANESLECQIKTRANRLGLQRRLKFEGRVPHQRVVQCLADASVGLITFWETTNHLLIVPTKLFEYMACGVPVVTSDLPPIRHYIEETNCGLLVPPRDAQAFAQAVEFLLDHPNEAHEMGRRGRQAVFDRYNWAPEEKKLLDLYRELLQC